MLNVWYRRYNLVKISANLYRITKNRKLRVLKQSLVVMHFFVLLPGSEYRQQEEEDVLDEPST